MELIDILSGISHLIVMFLVILQIRGRIKNNLPIIPHKPGVIVIMIFAYLFIASFVFGIHKLENGDELSNTIGLILKWIAVILAIIGLPVYLYKYGLKSQYEEREKAQ